MAIQTITSSLYRISLGFVGVFLILDGDDLVLVDTGTSGSDEKILQAINSLGKSAQSIRQIVITHLHTDHTGSLAAIKEVSGAEVCAHVLEADAIRTGQTMRPVQPGPSLASRLITRISSKSPRGNQTGVPIDRELTDGDVLNCGWVVLHTPGHTVGHIALKKDDVIILGDAATKWLRIGGPPLYEDYAIAQQSLQKISSIDFDIACFSHGNPIFTNAASEFRKMWG